MSGVAIEIKNYDELIDLCNQRAAELQLTRAQLDELAGLQEGYSSKVLRKSQLKKLGPISFHLFGALGVRLFCLQSDAATERTLARRIPRKECNVHPRDGERANV